MRVGVKSNVLYDIHLLYKFTYKQEINEEIYQVKVKIIKMNKQQAVPLFLNIKEYASFF